VYLVFLLFECVYEVKNQLCQMCSMGIYRIFPKSCIFVCSVEMSKMTGYVESLCLTLWCQGIDELLYVMDRKCVKVAENKKVFLHG